MIDWWRLWRVLRLAAKPPAAISSWIRWWPQLTTAVLWLLSILGLVHVKRLHIGSAWSATLFVCGIALLLLVAAYRLHPTSERERRDYAEHFLSQARWRGAILLENPALGGELITEWTNPITNFIHHAFGTLEVDKFIAPGVAPPPSPPGTRPGTGNVLALLDRLTELCERFPTVEVREYDLGAWRRMFSFEAWRFTFPADAQPTPPDIEAEAAGANSAMSESAKASPSG